MSEITKEQIVYVANELNKLLYDPPAIPNKGTKEGILKKMLELTESFGILERGDKLTDECVDIINLLGYNAILEGIGYPTDPPGSSNEPEPEEETPEPEPEDEHGPVDLSKEEPDRISDSKMTAAEPEEEVPEKVPVPEPVPKEEKDDTPMSAMSVDQFMDVLKKKGMAPIKRSASAFPRGQSPYTLAIHVCCKYPDITSNDLFKNFKKETGFEGEIGSHERRTIQTAHSYVRKIVRFLREYDHMPDKSTAPVKKPTTRKPTPKKNKA